MTVFVNLRNLNTELTLAQKHLCKEAREQLKTLQSLTQPQYRQKLTDRMIAGTFSRTLKKMYAKEIYGDAEMYVTLHTYMTALQANGYTVSGYLPKFFEKNAYPMKQMHLTKPREVPRL